MSHLAYNYVKAILSVITFKHVDTWSYDFFYCKLVPCTRPLLFTTSFYQIYCLTKQNFFLKVCMTFSSFFFSEKPLTRPDIKWVTLTK